ncbi:MAG: flagellar hook-basal body complex protein FliE [Alphaproteobacteria bacterium]|nr:MAG: flagellar hook-basal body complex protein FliE [Alphaproteobacteria bacterium]
MELAKAGQSLIGGIGGIGGLEKPAENAMGSFSDVLKNMVTQTVDAQKTAEQLSLAAAQGDPVALQDVVQAVSKAELTLQTLVTVRDRAVEAYQQIMQMPV